MTYSVHARHAAWPLAASLFASVVGCGSGSAKQHEPVVFAVGDSNDPVVKMALTLPAGNTIGVRVTNGSAHGFGRGIITSQTIFTRGQYASTALSTFISGGTNVANNVETLASALGLQIGVNAFVVPAIAAGSQVTVPVQLANSDKLNYLAGVVGSTDDFVAVRSMTVPNGTTASSNLVGYDINGTLVLGTIAQGNDTTGAAPANSTVSTANYSNCNTAATMNSNATLIDENFRTGTGSALWPQNIGWAGDFGGDWITDGITARMMDPNAPKPTVTGFVDFMSICPASGAKVSLMADVVTAYSSATSDTTVVVYFFDGSNNVISTAASHPLYKGNTRRLAVYDVAIPSGTRRIAAVPMAFVAANETGAAFYKRVVMEYEVAGSKSETSVATDSFAQFGASSYGANQPTGWVEFGGDWYANPGANHATLWNTSWGDNQTPLPPFDAGMYKEFTLPTVVAGDSLTAKLFAAVTFTDPTSFARLRLMFNEGTVVDGERLQGRSYGQLDMRRVAIPANATKVTVVINAYLGPSETSSLYVDDFSLSLVR